MVKKNKGMDIYKIIILCAIVFLLGVGGTLWFYALYKVVWTDYLPIAVHVPDTRASVGFTVDPTLDYGKVPPAGVAKKEITVWNEKDFPVLVKFTVSGEVASWMYVEENNFVLGPHENRKMNVFVNVPADTPLAEFNETVYHGEARIRHYRI